jgi:RNA polymerase sigma-70 factor (ECF subfamily)
LDQTGTERTQVTGEWRVSDDPAEFEKLVREHQAMVFSLACNFLGNRETAEELAQDVFLQLSRHLGSICSPLHLRAWLRRVTAHRCIDAARRAPRVRAVSLEDALQPAAASPDPDPLLARTLERLVRSLPPKARLMLILRYQEDLELREIAELVDLPVNTVKSSLHRSLALLRAKLARVNYGAYV